MTETSAVKTCCGLRQTWPGEPGLGSLQRARRMIWQVSWRVATGMGSRFPPPPIRGRSGPRVAGESGWCREWTDSPRSPPTHIFNSKRNSTRDTARQERSFSFSNSVWASDPRIRVGRLRVRTDRHAAALACSSMRLYRDSMPAMALLVVLVASSLVATVNSQVGRRNPPVGTYRRLARSLVHCARLLPRASASRTVIW